MFHIRAAWSLGLLILAVLGDSYWPALCFALCILALLYTCSSVLHCFMGRRAGRAAISFLIKVIFYVWVILSIVCLGPLQLYLPTLIDAWIKYEEHPASNTVQIIQDSSNSTVDIYAIHGLGSNPESAWTFRKDGTEVRWLQEILPVIEEFRPARIIMINHQTRWDSNAAAMTFNDHASRMLRDISHVHESREQTPIIFIAHSFGGLLLKQTLINAKLESNHVAEMTRGILFLGVPHGGTRAARELLSFITPNNEFLKNLERTFHEIYVRTPFRSRKVPSYICDFYEQRSEKLGRLSLGRLNSKTFGYEHGEAEFLDTDHRQLVKFQSQDDPNFEIFLRHLRKALSRAMEQEISASSYSHEAVHNADTNPDEFVLPFISNFYRHEHQLVGRNETLREIDRHFERNPASFWPRIVALTGLGGCGKTRIASEYASIYHKKFNSVFWIPAGDYDSAYRAFIDVGHRIIASYGDRELLNANYRRLAAALNHRQPAQTEGVDSLPLKQRTEEIYAVKRWFMEEGNKRWLLIFDEVDDVESFDIRDFFPTTPWGNILLTGRRRELRRFGSQIEIGDLPAEEALQLFTGLAGLNKRLLHQHSAIAFELLEALSYFPLAIVQACAYIRPHYSQLHPKEAITKYLRMYKENQNALLQHMPKPPPYDYHEHSVFTTWEVTFKAIEKQDPIAAKVLLWAGFLYRQDLLEDFFEVGMRFSRSNVSLQESFRLLSSYSMIEYQCLDAFSVHALVHSWVKERLDPRVQMATAVEVLQSLNLTLQLKRNTTSVHERISVTRRMIPHLNEAIYNVRRFHFTEHTIALFDGDSKIARGEYWIKSFVNRLYVSSLSAFRKSFYYFTCTKLGLCWLEDTAPANLLESIHPLGHIYFELDLWPEGEKLCRWTFLTAKNILGQAHPTTIRFALTLTEAVHALGHLDTALEMFAQVLPQLELIFGQAHHLTLYCLRGVSNVLRHQGRYFEAHHVLHVALVRAQNEPLKEDGELSKIFRTIGMTHAATGDFTEAIEWYQKALSTVTGLSQDITSGRQLMLEIGRAFQSQNQYDKALAWYLAAFKAFEEARKGDDPGALVVIYQVIMIYIDHGDTARAIEWCNRLPIFNQQQKYVHETCAGSIPQLSERGVALCRVQPLEDPLDWCLRALQGLDYIFRPNHPGTLAIYNQIGVLFRKLHHYSTAMRWFQETFARSEAVLGLCCPETLQTIGHIAVCYQACGQPEEATKWFHLELSRRITFLGLEDPEIFNTLVGIGSCMMDMGRLGDAKAYFRRARKGKEQYLWSNHPELVALDNTLLYLDRGHLMAVPDTENPQQ